MGEEKEKLESDLPKVVLRSSGEPFSENAEPLLQTGMLSSAPPKDKFLCVFFILMLHGAAVLAPWNMFITYCYPYFVNYKLATDYVNQTGTVGPELSDWQANFCQRMTVANQVPNMIFTILNCFIHFGEGTLGIRIVSSLLITVGALVATVILAVVDTSETYLVFIYVSLAAVVIMMSAIGVYQNSVWGLVAPLPMRYANAIILGNNFIGVIICLFSIATQLSSPDMKIAAIYYFMMGIFLLLAAFDTYFALPLIKFYRYYIELKDHHISQVPKSTFLETVISLFKIFATLWRHYWDVFITFFVTLFIFPNVAMWIAESPHEDFFIPRQLYSQILCFLTFNVFAFLGNLIPNVVHMPGPRFLWIFTTARLLFIPFFLLLNYQPQRTDAEVRRFPVLIPSSWVFWLAMVLMSVTHGHGSSLAMMYAPKQAEVHHQGKAAMLAGLFLVLGVNFGLIASAVVRPIMLMDA